GGIVLGALVEVGTYDANGVLQPLPGLTAQVRATFTVTTSNNPDLTIGAAAVALGTFSAGANGAVILALAGAFHIDASGNLLPGQVRLDFTGRITATPPQRATGWTFSITGNISRVTINNLIVRIGDVIEITVTQAIFGDDPLTTPVEV